MLQLDEMQTRSALGWPQLVAGIGRAYVAGCEMPTRHHHSFAVPGEADGTLLLMPAWTPGRYLGVKVVTVVPGNSVRSLPSVAGAYLLSRADTGELIALLDGAELTARRTAATSALAASFLARKNASSHLVIGAGRLALNLIEAHASVRDIDLVRVWARRSSESAKLVEKARSLGFNAEVAPNLQAAVEQSDIVSSCTLATEPLIKGKWVAPGTHLDLVGAFTPQMRETDDAAVQLSKVFADTKQGVLAEGGDIIQPLNAGAISEDHLLGDLFGLARNEVVGRTSETEITLYKSVGAALQDLAAAEIAFEAEGRAH